MNQVIIFGDRYQVGNKKLGKGSFGKVVRGLDTSNNKFVAIKKVKLKKLQKNPKLIDLFDQEIKLQKSLDSPYIVKLHNYYKLKECFYLVLEYCQDGDLEKYVRKHGPLNQKQAIGFSLQILAGFRALHSKSAVHRDLKPANILLHGKLLKIADLGASRVIQNGLDGKTNIGTPFFLAPEIYEGKQYGFEVDIFSFGVLLYFMLYNDFPFQGETYEELYQNMKLQDINFRKGGIIISRDMQDLLQQLLQFNRDQRITWKKIYEHPIISNNMQNDSISAEIILAPSIDDLSMYDESKFLNKKDEIKGNQIVEIQSVENNSKIIDVNLVEEQKIKLAQLSLEKDNDLFDGIKKYVHKKNIYGILINLVRSFKKLQTLGVNCYIPAFLVQKKLKSLNNELWIAIKDEINIFDMKFFNLFLKSAYYETIKLAIFSDQLTIDKYLQVTLEEAKESRNKLGIHNQKLENEINNMDQKDEHQESFKSSLIQCGYALQDVLKSNKQIDKASLFFDIMLIYQALSIDKKFKDNSNLDFDFENYKNELLEVEPKDYQTRMDEACKYALA